MSDVEGIQVIERRLDGIERNASDLARAHTEALKALSTVTLRVERLEEAHQDSREERAARIERDKALQQTMTTIQEDLKDLKDLNLGGVKADVASIKSSGDRIFWLVVGAVVVGFGGLLFTVIKGGLNIG